MEKITQLYYFANKLNKTVREEGIDIWKSEDSMDKISEIEEQFDKYTTFLC